MTTFNPVHYSGAPARRRWTIVPSLAPQTLRPAYMRVNTGGTFRAEDEHGNDVTETVVAGELLWFSPVIIHTDTDAVLTGYA